MKLNHVIIFFIMLVVGGLLAACGGEESLMDETLPVVSSTEPVHTPTATPVPTSLVVCLGEAPDTLYPYGNPNPTARLILQALYDGPIDHRGYLYQPIVLDGLPDLAAGTAVLQTVQVEAGDTVIDNSGEVVTLDYGVFIRPAGCLSGSCAEPFAGEQIEMDQMAALFVLRKGVLWADGSPLTIEDSVFGFSLNADPATPTKKFMVERTLSYEAQDDQTVKWTGIPGFVDPSYQENFWLPAPQHLWGQVSPADLLTTEISSQKPVGYGPFSLVLADSESFTLQRNPNYFRASEGLPRVDRVVFRVVGQNPQTNLDMLRSGECDLLDPSAAVGVGVVEIMASMAEEQLFASWTNTSGWTALNFGIVPQSYDDGYSIWAGDRPDFFGDPRTRQAVAFCLDRQAVTEEISLGITPVMDSYLPVDHPLVNIQGSVYRQDIEKAGELLDSAGWRLDASGQRVALQIEGIQNDTQFSFEILYVEHPQNARVVEIISEQLAACGIQAAPKPLTIEELFATGAEAPVFGRNFEMVYFAWQSSDEPPCQLFLSEAIPGQDENVFPYKWGGWNASGWSSEEYDAACMAAKGSAPGLESYAENHALAQEILMAELPVIPFFTYQHATLARPDICGLQFDPTAGMLWNIENIAFGAACP
jgi:peptide/nickel transport system substrate-binding protein